MEMDHHCIFLNSCVGVNNMRHFLLMLSYLIVGCTYTMAACTCLLWQERVAVTSNWSRQVLDDCGPPEFSPPILCPFACCAKISLYLKLSGWCPHAGCWCPFCDRGISGSSS